MSWREDSAALTKNADELTKLATAARLATNPNHCGHPACQHCTLRAQEKIEEAYKSYGELEFKRKQRADDKLADAYLCTRQALSYIDGKDVDKALQATWLAYRNICKAVEILECAEEY